LKFILSSVKYVIEISTAFIHVIIAVLNVFKMDSR